MVATIEQEVDLIALTSGHGDVQRAPPIALVPVLP